MSINSFFVDNSGSLFFISGSFTLSSSVSTSIVNHPHTESGISRTESIVTNVFPNPSTNAFATFKLDPNDPTSFMITGSNVSASFYMSSSGRVGFGTDDPLVAFDVRADEFQIQRQTKRQGVRVNEEGNLESFNSEADAASTGSEFILTYAAGGASKVTSAFLQTQLGVGSDEIADNGGATAYFNTLRLRTQEKLLFLLERESGLIDIASVGDTLGSIRWVAASGSADAFDKRVAGEAGNIKLTVASADNTGVTGKLSINLPADPTAASQELYSINGASQKHNFTGSVFFRDNVTFNGNIIGDDGTDITNINQIGCDEIFHDGDTDTKITFTNDDINITVGNMNMIDLTEDTVSEITFNEAGADLDFRVETVGDTKAIYVNAGKNSIQLGSAATSHVTASGNISASGFISASSFSGDGSGLTNVTATATIPAGTISSSLQTFTSITASGNISASGDLSIFGEVVHLEGTDPRLKLKAKGANHPGIEWHEDSTRKWVIYNDPDESDNLTFKNNTTEWMKLSQTGNLFVSQSITASGNISSSGTITADAITATLAAGTSNNVVVLNSSNQLVTDAVDGAIFGGAGALLATDNVNETLAGANLSEVTVGTATNAKTQRSTTNAEFFPVMVDSTNATATAEALKTPTTGFTFNPSSKRLTVDNITNVNTSHVTSSSHISASGGITGSHIFADGNISASGDIIANEVTASNIMLRDGANISSDHGTTLISLNNDDSWSIHANNSSTALLISNAGVRVNYQNAGSLNFQADGTYDGLFLVDAGDDLVEISGSLRTTGPTGHITASGNISSSGNVNASHITASGNVQANHYYGYQLSVHPSNFTVALNGSYYYLPLTGQSTAEHATSNSNERIPLVNSFNGHAIKTSIRSTNNAALNGSKITCSIFFEPPYNNGDFANNAPGNVNPGDTNDGHILWAEAHATGTSQNHNAVHLDWRNPFSGSFVANGNDIPSGSRVYLTMKSDFASSVAYVVSTTFAWDYSSL